MNIVNSLRKLKLFFMQKIKSLKEFIGTNDAEILIVIGAFLFAFATYKINVIACYYVLSLMFVGSGVFIAKTRR